VSTSGPGNPKHERQRAILELISRSPIASQEELVEHLRTIGHPATQATVSRDIAELGLAKVARGDRHVYVSPDDLGPAASAWSASGDDRLRRILADLPVAIARSGLTLVLRSGPGSASTIAQAIDQSSFDDQVGTLAGDDTVLVLFGDEARLEHWLARFRLLQASGGQPAAPQAPHATSAIPRSTVPAPSRSRSIDMERSR
jgi:transcriptional regulator of arginine metabolism